MAQLMPLPLTVSCFGKIQIGFTFLVQAYPGSPIVPEKGPLNRCVCVGDNQSAFGEVMNKTAVAHFYSMANLLV